LPPALLQPLDAVGPRGGLAVAPGVRVGRMSGGLLCAPDEDSWHAAHRTLFAGVSTY
jgi:hypothetical protein